VVKVDICGKLIVSEEVYGLYHSPCSLSWSIRTMIIIYN
jgi:hypothetical protein